MLREVRASSAAAPSRLRRSRAPRWPPRSTSTRPRRWSARAGRTSSASASSSGCSWTRCESDRRRHASTSSAPDPAIRSSSRSAGARGAGPADVVVYDRLASPALLALAPADAPSAIYVGKEPGAPAMPQDEINALLVERGATGRDGRAAQGRRPVRVRPRRRGGASAAPRPASRSRSCPASRARSRRRPTPGSRSRIAGVAQSSRSSPASDARTAERGRLARGRDRRRTRSWC